jgi:hypothetical protein
MSNKLRIGHGNGRNDEDLVDYVKQVKADSFSALEAQRLIRELRNISWSRVTVAGEDWAQKRDRSKSTAIITKAEHENLGEFTRKVSERIPGATKVAPDRVLVVSIYKHPVADLCGKEGVAHFALHPDAGPKVLRNGHKDQPIVREYSEAFDSTRKWMEAARRDNLLLFLTCDGQVRKDHKRPWGPRQQVADQLNLGARVVGIDWILFDRAVKPAGKIKTHPLPDHQGFIQAFEPR